jgi:putative MATE family efflux protein
MPSGAATPNMFTHGPLGAIFARTALPIIFVMSMNGLLAVVDAVFLGAFVGPDALGAVTLMFPLYMLIVALATLVASGMSSLLARHLGAARFDEARAVFAGAHGLALALSAVLIVLFLAFGRQVTLLAAAGSTPMAEMGRIYFGILVGFSPLLFVVAVNSDALRNEGRTALMALMSLVISLSNIGFNYILIVIMGLGVAGSASGTAMAWALALAMVLAFRLRGQTVLEPGALLQYSPVTAWRRILALGAPQSLNFIGLAMSSAAIISALQLVETATYATTVSAYGIVTRIMTFTFLPLLGLTHALQSITGNNYGAELWRRSDDSLRLGMMIALAYCLIAEIVLIAFAQPIGFAFVDDGEVAGEVARIMPVMVAMFFAAGPLVIIAAYFQAKGDAGRAAILGLSKPYLFTIPLTFLLPFAFGEEGIWMAGPTAEILLAALTVIVLGQTARREQLEWGLFKATCKVQP